MTRREQDERALAMVRLRARGSSLPEITRRMKANAGNIAKLTNAIMAEDMAHSGPHVADAYWERRV
ncbi:MAG: hypothetical protein RI571_06510 [Roseovarius sp.]|nr:hypothetical protein [Roseovarius sp.]